MGLVNRKQSSSDAKVDILIAKVDIVVAKLFASYAKISILI